MTTTTPRPNLVHPSQNRREAGFTLMEGIISLAVATS